MAVGSPNLLQEITQSLDKLRKSDRKVAEVILADPSHATSLKLLELAKLAGVSEPTIVRFCAAIGCDSFQDMKIRLARSLAFGISAFHSAISDADDLETVVEKIFDYNLSSLDWARSKLDIVAIKAAIDLIIDAKSLHFFGLGASSVVAFDAQQKFPLFGVTCTAVADVHQMIIASSMMGPGDVLIAISNTGTTREVALATRLAQNHGAATIGITGSESPLLRYCDVALLVETLENTDINTPTISRVASLVVMDILSTAVALRQPPKQREAVTRMKRYLADVRSTGII